MSKKYFEKGDLFLYHSEITPGIYVVYMWYICGIYVVYMCICGVYVVYMWYMFSFFGRYWVCVCVCL